jgi:hypothetical protein
MGFAALNPSYGRIPEVGFRMKNILVGARE